MGTSYAVTDKKKSRVMLRSYHHATWIITSLSELTRTVTTIVEMTRSPQRFRAIGASGEMEEGRQASARLAMGWSPRNLLVWPTAGDGQALMSQIRRVPEACLACRQYLRLAYGYMCAVGGSVCQYAAQVAQTQRVSAIRLADRLKLAASSAPAS